MPGTDEKHRLKSCLFSSQVILELYESWCAVFQNKADVLSNWKSPFYKYNTGYLIFGAIVYSFQSEQKPVKNSNCVT